MIQQRSVIFMLILASLLMLTKTKYVNVKATPIYLDDVIYHPPIIYDPHTTININKRDDDIHHLYKRQATQTSGPAPTTTRNPGGGNPNRPPATTTRPPQVTTAPPRPSTNERPTTRSSSGRASNTGNGPAGPEPTDDTNGGTLSGANEPEVPTTVSTKLFISLGVIGGVFILSLGGVAFCRHRRKKSVAKELLQQTAQFNNNNPYAKIEEAAAQADAPTAPAKPIGTYSVVATYTPALADEIDVAIGDSVTVLQEYDDGWCMGINNTRNKIKGVFPKHCLDIAYEGSQHGGMPPNAGFQAQAKKRMSSIAAAPNGWNGGAGFNANYPPQPSPSFNGPPPYGMPPGTPGTPVSPYGPPPGSPYGPPPVSPHRPPQGPPNAGGYYY